MLACFGAEIAADKLERGDRFLEESLELLQSGDYPKERAYALIEYVFGRDKGEPQQEVGGVMITLAAYCLAHAIDMHQAGEIELARVWTKVDAIRAKQATKPTGSALPVAVPVSKMPTEHRFPCGLVERDLLRLTMERVGAAVRSVQQLAEDDEVKFQIALGAAIATIGTAAGTYKAVYAPDSDGDPHTFAEIVLKMMRDAGSDAHG